MNTIHPSQKPHSVMSSRKDVAPAMGTDRVLKRPSSSSSSPSHGHGHSGRQGHHHNYTLHHNTTNHTHAHAHTHHHQQQQQQRQQPKDSPVNNSSGQSSSSSRSLHSSLSLSRQTWTHSAFTRLTNESESNGSKGQHHSQLGQQQQQQQHIQQTHASRLSLAGVCSVRIGPHLFLDTKFYTVVSNPSPTPIDSNSLTARSMGPSLALKQEPIPARPQPLSQSPQHQVAMEFKENPGKVWLFPHEASVEFSPADDRDSAQILASFHLPTPEPESSGRLNRSSPSSQAISMTIMQATSALWEGLELAVSGPHTVITRSPTTKPKSSPSRPHIPSTHSEDTSEILGSGKTAKQPLPSNGTTTKRQQDKAVEYSSKSAKTKQQKDQEDKGRGPTTKGPGGISAAKKAAASGPASNSTQKRCGYCNCTTTPMWRRGPNGPSTLCNACGVKWKHGKIMQDVTQSQPTPTSGLGSSTTPSAPRSSNSSKSSKESQENGYSRQAESKKSVNKTNHSGGSSSSIKTNHDAACGESSSPQDKPKVKDGGRRGSDADKIVPVKKRHLATSVSPPIGGPRMVPIHELDDLIHPPSNSSPVNLRKHGYDDDGDDDDDDDDAYGSHRNGRTRQKKNGVSRSHQGGDSHSTSGSTRSAERDVLSPHQSPSSADDGLSLYATKNLYTNNTATFPLHFPTISIGFGPNNAYYTYPNCAVILFENHFQIKLIQGGERTEIDVWKEGIEGTEFQVVDVGDGESMIVMKALLRQYLTRFDKELLNPDRNESLIIFRFRERLDGGGPSVKPLLEHWLATDIPVPPVHPSQDTF